MDAHASAQQAATRASVLAACTKQHLVSALLRLELGLEDAAAAQMANDAVSRRQHKAKGRKRQREMDWSKYTFHRVALRLAYIGEGYRGLALQSDVDDTVEEHVLRAMEKAKLIKSRDTCNMSKCGRTDKGVSAMGNVLSVDLRSLSRIGADESTKKPASEYMRVLNRLLPTDIRITGAAFVSSDFSARFNCSSRTYKYFFFEDELDIQAMRAAANRLNGTHDFRNLCKMDVRNMQDHVRRILRAEIKPASQFGGGSSGTPDALQCFTVEGTGFLYHQVRCMMAVLFMVGRGLENPDIIDKLLDVVNHPCKPEYTMASEAPLVLYSCQFPNVQFEATTDPTSFDELHRFLRLRWRQACMRSSIWSMFANAAATAVCHSLPVLQLEACGSQKQHVELMKRYCGRSFEQQVAMLSGEDRKKFEEKKARTQLWRQQRS